MKPSNHRLVCEIKSQKDVYRLGDTPQLSVRIINKSSKSVCLIGNLDGSESKRRYPHLYFTVSGVETGLVEPFRTFCGNVNPLRIEDFVQLLPGDRFDPYMRIDDLGFWPTGLREFKFKKVGKYTFTFNYSTMSGELNDWVVPLDNSSAYGSRITANILSLRQQVPHVILTCAVTVQVKE
jgi:hypothetical protein